MTRGTTPTFILTLPDSVDLEEAANVYATFRRGTAEITKTGDDLDIAENTVSVYMTQEETLSFRAGTKVEIQLNWTFDEGSRACSEIVTVNVGDNLLPEVLS